MTEDQYTRLFASFKKFFDAVDTHFEETQKELSDIRDAIAELSAQVRDYHREMVLLSH